MEKETASTINNTGQRAERPPKLTASTGQELRRLAHWCATKTPLHFQLINGGELKGHLVWWDLYCLRVELPMGKRIILPKHSILYFGEDDAKATPN